MTSNVEPKTGAPVWPRITLVTAVYNGEKYLEDTIRSVVSQGYPNLEYIIVDDGSSDGTVEIIRRYEQHLACWFSQENTGLYAALNAGFARSSGEIMGWLNASDMLQVNGLFVVGSVFATFREVGWITGRPTKYSSNGMTVDVLDVLAKEFVGGSGRADGYNIPRGGRLRIVGAVFSACASLLRGCVNRRVPRS